MNAPTRTLTSRLPATAACALAALGASGQTFEFKLRDAVLGIRKEGAISEVVVNLGPVSRFYAATPGEVITVTNISPAQLAAALPELAGGRWSVTSASVSGDGGDPAFPARTLWLSRPRQTLDTPAVPWVRQNSISQGNPANRVVGIGINAESYATLQSGPDPLANTPTVVVIPSGNPLSYGIAVGPQGNLDGAFGQSGTLEATIPEDFSASTPSRVDFFEMLPASGADVGKPGRHVGYFELRSDNTFTFVAAGGRPEPQPARILLLTRTAGTSAVTFESVAGLMYRLRYADTLGAAVVSNWLTGPTVTAAGTNAQLEDSTASAARFYAVETLP
jgi:hypothetical protein